VTESVTGIVKKNQVRPAGACAIGAKRAASPQTSGKTEVRILEQHDDHALLEIRCSCGRYTYVQCRWPVAAPVAPTGPAKPRTNA
jgi:hypothetical protein